MTGRIGIQRMHIRGIRVIRDSDKYKLCNCALSSLYDNIHSAFPISCGQETTPLIMRQKGTVSMRWHREAYLELLTFGHTERPMFVELFGPLAGLEAEWAAQGASAEEIGMVGFDWDYVPVVGCGGNTEMRGGRTPEIIEETADYLISTDELGRTLKLCKGYATLPLPLDYPVKAMADWLRIKPCYTFHDERIDWAQVAAAREAQTQGAVVLASIPGGFDLPRQLMGEEGACLGFYDQPELMLDILQTVSDTAFQVLERISERLLIDNLCVHEDMAGKSGPLIGPATVREFIQPYYRRIWECSPPAAHVYSARTATAI